VALLALGALSLLLRRIDRPSLNLRWCRDRGMVLLLAGGPGLLEAQSYAFAVMGVTTAVTTLTAAFLMMLYAHRIKALAGAATTT
jgi:hypothetical protein